MKTPILLFLAFIYTTSIFGSLRKPDWVKNRPNDAAFYIGIGTAKKSNTKYQYITQARNQALQQLSSEIKVTISANSVLQQFETNYELKEAFESKTQSSLTQTLEGYDVFTWEDKNEYWVMMRLSKDKYAMDKRIALEKAKKIALMYLNGGKKAIEDNDPYLALLQFSKAVNALKNNTEDDLLIKSFDGEINLVSNLYQAIQNTMSRIIIRSNESSYAVKISSPLQSPIKITASFKTNDNQLIPIFNLPLSYQFTKGDGEISAQSATDFEGNAHCTLGQLLSKRKLQEISIGINKEALQIQSDAVIHAFFPDEIFPKATIRLEVEKSTAFFISDETIFGDKNGSRVFTNEIKSLLGERYFTFTSNSNADYTIHLSSTFTSGEEKKGNGYSVFIVYGDLTISVTDNANQTEILNDGLSNTKGMQPGDYEHALTNCRKRMLDAFEKKITPRLDDLGM